MITFISILDITRAHKTRFRGAGLALRFCTKCGDQNSEMALFCGSCGSKIENGRLSDETENSDISTPTTETEEQIIPGSLPEDLKSLSASSRV